jgi:hypothetical protein
MPLTEKQTESEHGCLAVCNMHVVCTLAAQLQKVFGEEVLENGKLRT